MRFLPWLFATLIVISSAAGRVQNPHNAATWYQRAMDQFNQLPQEQRELLTNEWDPAQGPPSPQMRAALTNAQSILQNFQRGSLQDYSNFNLDYSQGFELLLPHLQPLRALTKLARTDAQVRMFDGDNSGAADRIAMIYRVSGHETDDGFLISSLVGQAIFQAGDGIAQQAIDRGALDPADSAKLLAAIKRLGTDDPFCYTEGLAAEQDVGIAWMTQKWSTPEGRQEALAALQQSTDDASAQALMALNDQEFRKALDEYDSTMNRVVEAFSMKDPEAAKAALDKISKEIEAGEHGPLVQVLVPAFGRLLEKKLIAQQMIAERTAVLEKLANGDVKPEEIANAAVWYARGIEQLDTIDPGWLAVIRDNAGDISKPLTDDLVQEMESKQVVEIIDTFRDGSLKMRCNFAAVFPGVVDPPALALAPAYAPGMHDALRLLRLDAVRLIRGGDRAAAADRLEISLRIIAHMSGDPTLTSALIAYRDFSKTIPIIDAALQMAMFDLQTKAALHTALERIGHKDPFGFVAAVAATREALVTTLKRQAASTDDERKRREQAVEAIAHMDGDHLLYILTALDTIRRSKASASANPPDPPAAVDPLSRLEDVLSKYDMDSIRKDVPAIEPLLVKGNIDVFAGRDFHVVAPVSDYMRRARGELRRSQLLLAPPQGPKPLNSTTTRPANRK